MEICIHHPNHMLSMLSGFESLNTDEHYKDSDVKYLTSVLKVNGCDFEKIEGSEGFFSAIRAAGAKIYEMIKNFIKKIKDFFFGSNGSKQEAAIKDTEKTIQVKSLEIKTAVKKVDYSTKTPRYNNEKMESLGRDIEAARRDADRLMSTMGTGKGLYVRLDQMVGDREKQLNVFDLSKIITSEFRDIIELNSNGYDLLRLDETAKKLMNTMRREAQEPDTTAQPGGVVLKSVELANTLAPQIGDLSRQARKSLDQLTKDLHLANEAYAKFEKSGDTDSTEKARRLVIILSRAGSQLSQLISQCASTLSGMNFQLKSMAASLELSSGKEETDRLQAAFAGAKDFIE